MNTAAVVTLARKHVGNGAVMESSARLCLADAIVAWDSDAPDTARVLAVKSLAYSVGVFHPDYIKAAA